MNRAAQTVDGSIAMVDQTFPIIARAADQSRCPLLRAALRLHDVDALRVVARLHPPRYCPAARRAARLAVSGGR